MDEGEMMTSHTLITGALGGLGTAMVQQMAELGHSVIACDRQVEAQVAWLEAFDEPIRSRVMVRAVDVTQEDQVDELASELQAEGISVSRLVNNAGVLGLGYDTKVWRRTMDVSATGTFFLTRAFVEPMKSAGFGRIVNIASQSAYVPPGEQGPYAAAKAAVIGWTRANATGLAPHGITVNAIAPGLIVHRGLKAVYADEQIERMSRTIPVGRPGRPQDIARTLAFLLDDDAGYITGQVIHVNGGAYLSG
jgi:NAD(P)-dependent dehydrogenase (short-subunit alcohol dehydrogenase family)